MKRLCIYKLASRKQGNILKLVVFEDCIKIIFKLYRVPEINGKPLKMFSSSDQYRARFTNDGVREEKISCDECQEFWFNKLSRAEIIDGTESPDENNTTQTKRKRESTEVLLLNLEESIPRQKKNK